MAFQAALATCGALAAAIGWSMSASKPRTAAAAGGAAAALPFDVQAVGKDIVAALEANASPQVTPATLVRLAWHDCGTWEAKSGTGGCHASMRFAPESEHGANAGLAHARAFLEPIHQKHPGIGYADLWTFASGVAIEHMGGPHIEWRWGRKDARSGAECAPDGRLPDASKGAAHIREVFGRMGLTDREAVVLIGGGHAVGKCHADRSGFVGPWKHDFLFFDNGFFRNLFDEKWAVDKTKKQLQYTDEATKKLMMLPTDLAMRDDAGLAGASREFAANNDKFQAEFAAAYKKLMEFGGSALHPAPQFRP